jgi:hypothetical protein
MTNIYSRKIMRTFTKLSATLALVSGLFAGTAVAAEVESNVVNHGLKEIPTASVGEGLPFGNGGETSLLATAYMDEAFNTPRVYYGNQWYAGAKLSSPVYVPSSNSVYSITWEWNVNKTVAGTTVVLCSLTTSGGLSKCADVSSLKTGTDRAFFNGQGAAGGFQYYFNVNNGGAYVNMTASKTKVIVNHQ